MGILSKRLSSRRLSTKRLSTRRLFRRFDFVPRSAWWVIGARGLRAFAHGFLSVGLAIFLTDKGLGLGGVGLFLSAGVAGGALWALGLGALISRFGRRRSLVGLTLVSAGFSAALLTTDSPAWLAIFSLLGGLSGVGGAGGAGPAQPLEQTILADACPSSRHASLFALYRFVASGATAAGGLAAGIPGWLESAGLLSMTTGLACLVAAFALCLLAVAGLYSRLPASVESEPTQPAWSNPLNTPSRHLILRLNALFGVDQLGSSLVPTALLTYWFHSEFGLELGELAVLAASAHLLSAFSMVLSARLSARIGYVRTMVFSHLPASLMLVALPFAPNVAVAVALWLGRGLLSQMDIPARDALIMAAVPPDERVAMASVHLMGRNGMGTVGPVLATALWQSWSAAAPLLGGGLLKVGYDLALYSAYRKHRFDESE
jgi:MFS family permease